MFAITRSTNTTSAGVSRPPGRRGSAVPSNGVEAGTCAGYAWRSRPTHRHGHPPPTPVASRLAPRATLGHRDGVPTQTGGSLSRSVLIVDDEQHIRLLIEQALEELADDGVELYTASDGEEALEVIEAQRPDLVFLDVMMPKRNGLEVCRAVRSELGLGDAHIVLLTAKGQAHDREEGLAAGANRYLTKPFDPDELLAIAHDVLGPA
jgi:two-component system alkaline phosphatase synthesis response regulator PhoP